jgi:hypothetical protein
MASKIEELQREVEQVPERRMGAEDTLLAVQLTAEQKEDILYDAITEWRWTCESSLYELNDVLIGCQARLGLSWISIRKSCRKLGLCLMSRNCHRFHLQRELSSKRHLRIHRRLLRGPELKEVRRAFLTVLVPWRR